MLTVIAIIGFLAAIAIPSFSSVKDKTAIEIVAENLSTHIKWARSEAIKRNQDVKIMFTPGTGNNWKYKTWTAGTPSVPLKNFDNNDDSLILEEDFCNDQIIIDHINGTNVASTGSITFSSNNGDYQLKVLVGYAANPYICWEGAAIGGYAQCPSLISPVCP